MDGPLTGSIRTAITRAPAGLCRRMVRHSGQGEMVSGEVGEFRFGARRPPQRLRGLVGNRRMRGMNRKPCARTSTGARSGSTADPTGPVKSRSNRPGRNRLGYPDPVIYSAQCLLTFQIRYFTVPFQCAYHPYGRLENHRQLLTNLSRPCPKQVSVLFCCRRKIFLLTTAR